MLTALNPHLALKVMCSDPLVEEVADVDAGDCEYIEDIRVEATSSKQPVQPPFDDSKYATKEELARAFKKSQAK